MQDTGKGSCKALKTCKKQAHIGFNNGDTFDTIMVKMWEISITYRHTYFNPRPAGGADSAPLSNSRRDGRRKTGKTANESSQQDES